MKLSNYLEAIEAGFLEIAIRIVSLLGPLPSAFLVYSRTVEHLKWPEWVGFVAGAVVEGLGITSLHMALLLSSYNTTKRKTDPVAYAWIAWIIAGVYLITVIFLTVALDTAPALAIYAPVAFPLISACGAGLLVLRYNHVKRLNDIAEVKTKEKADREQRKQNAIQVQPVAEPVAELDTTGKVIAFYRQYPGSTQVNAASQIGISRQRVGQVIADLQAAGIIRKNGNGIEVINEN